MIKKVIIQLIVLQFLFPTNIDFNEEKVIKMMYEYFTSSKDSTKLIGHRFYESSGEMIFQLELETNPRRVNEALIHGFNSISKFSSLSKIHFTHSILVIHFEGNILPIVAESNIRCLKRYFIQKRYNENQWRKNCLRIKSY